MTTKRPRKKSDLVGELKDVAQRVVELACRAGADDAEVILRDGRELTAKVRLGEPELVQEAGSRGLGLRVFCDRRCASTFTSDLRAHSLAAFVDETVALAALAEPDDLNRLPDPEDLATEVPDLDLYDERVQSIDAAEALRRAGAAEAAARGYDPRITNSDGATWSRNIGAVAFASSGGFVGGYRGTLSSLYVQPMSDDEGGKKRNGYWWTAGRFLDSLAAPEEVGEEAARRTVAQLGSRKVDTCEVPVVFDPEAGRSIAGMFFNVANGAAFYRKSSYLLDREGTQVAAEIVTITDDPRIRRGPGSRPFDGDGLPTARNTLIRDGQLDTVLCDVYSARKLGRRSTGSAGRSVGGAPAPTTSNLIMQPGKISRDELIGATDRGFYVTSIMGFGFNPVTGDFSHGAFGFWIEDGELSFPVSEVTISAHFDDLLKRIDLIADDLELRTTTSVPTFRVSQMTLAGR